MRHEPVENPHDPLARQRRVDFDAKYRSVDRGAAAPGEDLP